MSKGRLIVIDGTDGSGKSTQTQLLVQRLKKNKISAIGLDFPQYETHFGKLIARYLNNEFGWLDPYVASVLYAANRLEFRDKILQWLKEGKTIVLNRYVTSNQVHQAANIENKSDRKVFVNWVEKMEYDIFSLPKPDAVLFLHIDPVVAYKLMEKKSAKARKYANGTKRDILEADLQHQREAINQSLKLLKDQVRWKKIDCMDGETLLTKAQISDKIWAALN